MLNLYRRHHRTAGKCIANQTPDSRSYEGDEKRRGWKRCDCPIYASGTLGDRFHRKNTDQTTWDTARIQARTWEDAGSWTGLPPTRTMLTVASAVEVDPSRKTIEFAIDKYLDAHRRGGTAELTIEQYRERSAAFKRFSDTRGYVFLDQWTVADVCDYRDQWGSARPTTRQKKLQWVRLFFRFAIGREWITINPAAEVSIKDSGIGRNKSDSKTRRQKAPFTNDELTQIYTACLRLPDGKPARNGSGSWPGWTGRDVLEFIVLSVYTGLRISDVAQFHAGRMDVSGTVLLRQHKTDKPLRTKVPDWVRDIVRDRAAKHGDFIFRQHSLSTTRTKAVTLAWRRKLKRAFDEAARVAPFASTPSHHRFRHTFARILLESRVSIETVAELLGDTEAAIREYYGDWCLERQQALVNELTQAFAGQERPAGLD